MIRFTTNSGPGRRLIGLGLSRENIDRLIEDNPIVFKGDEMGLVGTDFLIFFGETEKEMAEQLAPFIGEDTNMTISKLKKIVVSTMSGLFLVMLQPLAWPWLGQFLLERGL